ncbi:MAG TPA: TRAP transporter large permease, partial [Syntrophorhabdaceae bacterium]|nr:TRAP transporter large permease [Syntrophorhabdaceae bacterium]
VLMGCIAFRIGMSKRIFDASYVILGSLRGGLAIASIMGSAAFAAICGSTNATAAAMGTVALPQMKRYNYDDSLATGCVASAGTLGILIPPSALLIIYGIISEQSIGKLFLAGVIPGIILAFAFVVTVSIICWRNPLLGPSGPSTSFIDKLKAIPAMVEVLILFLLVLGGLMTGWFSATQAGGAGALAVTIIGLIRRDISWKAMIEASKDTLLITCMVMFVLFGAILFSRFMAVTKIPFILSSWIGGLNLPKELIMIFIIIVHLIGGCFMDGLAMIMLTVPILLPSVISLGYDPIWFGIIITLIVEMGAITPPVGINVYVIKGIASEVPLETIFRGIFPFLIALILVSFLLIFFPNIVLFLPGLFTF